MSDLVQPQGAPPAPGIRPCVWMSAGLLSFKLCDRGFDCDRCPLFRALQGHPAAPQAPRCTATGGKELGSRAAVTAEGALEAAWVLGYGRTRRSNAGAAGPESTDGEAGAGTQMEDVSILVVDDEFSVRDSLTQWFRKDGYTVEPAESAARALSCLRERRFDVVFLDIKMPGMDGMELQERIRELDPSVSVIIVTAYASVDTAVRAMKQGAFDYICKPVDPDELSHLVQRAVEQQRLRRENAKLRATIDELRNVDMIVGESPGMQKVFELIELVAGTDATVLIRGESGTGKELVARAIHASSSRRYGPIVPVNCGALPETLLESELFGHEKGAFTGAQYRRKGKIEMAEGGTLFLDEIGTIGLKMQVDLLRVLESREFCRLGASKPVKVDFRVVCATNQDLREQLDAGTFREDLFYRVNVFAIEVPPLRERRADIPALARHFVEKLALQMDKRILEISPTAMERLVAHDWPGNVRELANAIERAMVVGKPPRILPQDLPFLAAGPDSQAGPTLADMEKHHIAATLEKSGWNIKRAAEWLQIDRATLYNKIEKYRLREPPGGR